MITPDQALGLEHVQGAGRSHLCGQRRLETLHGLPGRQDGGARRRRPGLCRYPLRPLHRGRLAGSAHPHPRFRRGAREARHRRDAGAGGGLLRHDLGLHAARRHHRADAVLRSRSSAGRRRDRRQDSGVPDRAVSAAAVLQGVLGQLHADRLRVALAGPMAAAVHAAAHQRHQLLSLPLGLEPAQRIRRDRHQGHTRPAS